MRGKASRLRCFFHTFRITPAYAGKRQAIYHRCGATKDHPRLCGEKCKYSVSRSLYAGSPPPMRGKAGDSKPFALAVRITPAYAGKSCLPRGRSSENKDHPRLCGEKHHPKAPQKCKPGITPAYAGKSSALYRLRGCT